MSERHVLVVDDEPAIQRILKRLLSRCGCKVFTADDTVSARRLLKYHHIDLVMCDYLMPGENGLQFLRELKRSHPHILRVMITGQGDMDTAISAINTAQVQFYFTKPFDFDTVQSTVEELLDWSERKQSGQSQPFTAQRVSLMADLKSRHPGIDQVVRDSKGAIVLDEDCELFSKDLEDILGLPAARPVKTSPRSLIDDEFLKVLEG